MRTRYILHIATEDYELQDDDLENWADISCTYKRADYDGVIRSFTSKFAFVNHARELLLELYLRERFDASASFEILTMNESWGWDSRFVCQLDFSTIEWNDGVLNINAVDNSLAALIKANKGTKYEFVMGKELLSEGSLLFDRIPMLENLTYKFTQGATYEDSEDITVTFKDGERPWVGNAGNETAIGGLAWKDDQETDANSYLFKANKDLYVTFNASFTYRMDCIYGGGAVAFYLKVKREGEILPITNDKKASTGCYIGSVSSGDHHNFGTYTSPDQLPDISSPIMSGVTDLRYGGYAMIGDIVWECQYKGGSGRFAWNWTGKTREQYFPQPHIMSPVTLALKAGDIVFMDLELLAGAKTLSVRFTKSEFKFKWKCAGDPVSINVLTPAAVAKAILGRIAGHEVDVEISDADTRLPHTYLMAAESIRAIEGAKFYSSFTEFCDWIGAVFGYVYRIEGESVRFMHRSELFMASDKPKRISESRELQYRVDSAAIYSSVVAGYDKKDYGSINGRDEFNFNIEYSTGCTVSDKKRQLLSKYRADCYGIEFAAQKRNDKTTDTTSDKDVFFALCKGDGNKLAIDRDIVVSGGVSDALFNGAFSPAACVRANAGLIGLQADAMTLSFTSSTGNSDIAIDGEKLSTDIELDEPLTTCGEIEFVTADTDVDPDSAIEVSSGGLTYIGHVKDVDMKFARPESAKYKLIVKSILP